MNLISKDPEIMHGEPCFSGTRVPVQTLFDYVSFVTWNELEGSGLEDFLEDFPTVSRDVALAVLEVARKAALHKTA